MNTIRVFFFRFLFPRRYWYRNFYLNSNHWYAVAHEARRRAGYKCQSCGQAKPLDVHHRVYWFLFFEQYAIWTLQALCRECHERMHNAPL